MSTATPLRPQDRRAQPGAPMAASGRQVVIQVVGARVAARDTVTFALALPGTTRAPVAYRPGQFITLALPAVDGATLYRS